VKRLVAIIGIAAVVQLALAIALSLHFMFLSGKGALLTALIAAYAAAAGLLVARAFGRRTLSDVEAIQSTLRAVADGRRDAHTGVTGDGDLARLAADVDAMVDRLADEERARRMLITAVSHDLRTPLGALALLASAIDDEIADAETRREYAARIATHVQALGELTDALFELTRLESGSTRSCSTAPRRCARPQPRRRSASTRPPRPRSTRPRRTPSSCAACSST
jgi:signal transduction histidine kinase